MKKQVFPVCRPGSKTFTSSNKKEGGKAEAFGVILYSETEDKDVVHLEFIAPNPNAGDFFGSWFLADTQEKSEFLADLSVAPQTDAVVATNELWGIITPWEYGSTVSTHPLAADAIARVWGEVNGKSWFDTYPEPGSIFCFGVKQAANSAWRNFYNASRTIYGQQYDAVTPPENVKHPFNDGTYSPSVVPLFPHRLGEWHTVMFTGTRWVLLGSNNWY